MDLLLLRNMDIIEIGPEQSVCAVGSVPPHVTPAVCNS